MQTSNKPNSSEEIAEPGIKLESSAYETAAPTNKPLRPLFVLVYLNFY